MSDGEKSRKTRYWGSDNVVKIFPLLVKVSCICGTGGKRRNQGWWCRPCYFHHRQELCVSVHCVQEMFLKALQVKPLKLGWLVSKRLKLTERKEVCLSDLRVSSPPHVYCLLHARVSEPKQQCSLFRFSLCRNHIWSIPFILHFSIDWADVVRVCEQSLSRQASTLHHMHYITVRTLQQLIYASIGMQEQSQQTVLSFSSILYFHWNYQWGKPGSGVNMIKKQWVLSISLLQTLKQRLWLELTQQFRLELSKNFD